MSSIYLRAGRPPTLIFILAAILFMMTTGVGSNVHAGDRPGPFLDVALGIAHQRNGWGPGLELRPGYAFGQKWSAYVTLAYAIHATDLYHNDAAGFVGAGLGYLLRDQSGVPILLRVGVVQFDASYQSSPASPPENPIGFQMGFDIKWSKHWSCGAEWTFQANSPKDAILFLPVTLSFQW
jgi:hypothetical protein